MDLFAFFSGICVASVGFFVISRFMLKSMPDQQALARELNSLHAKLSALSLPATPASPMPAAARPFTKLDEKRAEVIADLYARLASLQRHLNEAHVLQTAEGRLYFGGREATERDIEQKLEREKAAVFEKYQQLSEFVAGHRIFFDATMLESLDAILSSFHRIVAQSVTSGAFRRGGGATLNEVMGELTAGIRLIEARFKEIFGVG